jgi:hypothetical protein
MRLACFDFKQLLRVPKPTVMGPRSTPFLLTATRLALGAAVLFVTLLPALFR